MIIINYLFINNKVVMQRIKSQSTCNTHNIAITSQSRPRSKKTAKAQSI